jgi:hypothetical protein
VNNYISLLKQSKSKIAELEEVQVDDYLEASTYALSLYNAHYKNKPDAVNFELCNSVAAVITQIDNMATGVIAELQKENALLKQVEQIFNDSPDLTFVICQRLFQDEFEAHNLEQQAKSIDSLVDKLMFYEFDNQNFISVDDSLAEFQELRNQAKALKEGKQ